MGYTRKEWGAKDILPFLSNRWVLIWTDSSCTSMVTSCTFIILTYFHFSFKKKTKIAFIHITAIHFLSTLRVAQTAKQLKTKYIVDYTTRNYIFCTFYIAGCITRNIKLFLNTLRVVQTAIQNSF